MSFIIRLGLLEVGERIELRLLSLGCYKFIVSRWESKKNEPVFSSILIRLCIAHECYFLRYCQFIGNESEGMLKSDNMGLKRS